MSASRLLCQRVCFSGKLVSFCKGKKDALQRVWMGSTCQQGSAMAQAELSTAEIPWGGNQKRKAILAGEVEKEIRKGLFLTLSFKRGGGRNF